MNNPILYSAALSGFIAGSQQSRYVTQTDPVIYAALVATAATFAEDVDALIPFDPLVSSSDALALSLIVAGVYAERYQQDTAPAFALSAAGIVTLYNGQKSALPPLPIAVPGNVIEFQPGGTPSDGVYTTEADLVVASQAFGGGPYWIYWNLSNAPTPGFYTFETVGELALASGGMWTDTAVTPAQPSPAQFSTQLTFANGTVIPNPPSDIYGFIQIECNQPYPNIAFTATVNSGKTTFHDFTGAWVNAGMAPLIHSDGYWLLVADDSATFNYGPVAGSPLPIGSLDYLSQVNIYMTGLSYMGPLTINFPFNYNGTGFVDPSNYPYMAIGGLFNDPTGTGASVIPAGFAGTINSSLALLFSQGGGNTGTLYYSNGTTWVPIVAAP
jgi:hypothetical protein